MLLVVTAEGDDLPDGPVHVGVEVDADVVAATVVRQGDPAAHRVLRADETLRGRGRELVEARLAVEPRPLVPVQQHRRQGEERFAADEARGPPGVVVVVLDLAVGQPEDRAHVGRQRLPEVGLRRVELGVGGGRVQQRVPGHQAHDPSKAARVLTSTAPAVCSSVMQRTYRPRESLLCMQPRLDVAQDGGDGGPVHAQRRGGATDRAYARLRADVLDGELPPGAVLAELEQSARLGVSRTPVREAFAKLVHDGLARPVGGRGLVVAPLELGDLDQLYDVREALEVKAARLAARAPGGRGSRSSPTASGTPRPSSRRASSTATTRSRPSSTPRWTRPSPTPGWSAR